MWGEGIPKIGSLGKQSTGLIGFRCYGYQKSSFLDKIGLESALSAAKTELLSGQIMPNLPIAMISLT